MTTIGDDGRDNIGPMSSVWALGWSLMLGLECGSRTYENLMQQEMNVVNFPSALLFKQVEKIANLTGANPVPEYKRGRYRYDPDKFTTAGFTRLRSELVQPPRIAECSIQLEAVLKNVIRIEDDPMEPSMVAAVETRVVRVHVDERLVVENEHIDPVNWKPLIYNFRHYYGLGQELGKTFKAEV